MLLIMIHESIEPYIQMRHSTVSYLCKLTAKYLGKMIEHWL